MNSTLVIIPTYNEAGNIVRIIEKIHQVAPDFSILVVDDNSSDGTATAVQELMATDRRVNLMQRAGKLGLGTAYLAGFKWALERDFEFVFEMDADFSHNPDHLPAFMEAAKDADLVLGSRYIPGGGVVNWSFIRRVISRGGGIYSRTILGLPYHDLTGGFKLFRRRTLEGIGLEKVFSEGYSFQIELTYRAHKKGFKIVETPIIFEERQEGASKMSRKIFLEAVIRVWQLRFKV
ncbi:MAG: polyprenol monophosphomannose synthase [Nitrospinota bacterium]|nr:polyprenol monophosphomannose synthase [Nitrospinota bacterium]MDH5679362.1 polyprenol monophosphomannose synthase [Nitrospinota bacterium]